MNLRTLLFLLPAMALIACGSDETTNEITTGVESTDTISEANPAREKEVETSLSPAFKHDEYLVEDNNKGMILLCHRAGWSRGEYLEIAPVLNELGYSCIAIDQRSGREVNGIENVIAASYDQDSTTYEDAIPDIEFAIDRAYQKNGDRPIVLWGSSYSSTLALLLGPKNEKVKAIVSFSPGDYFPEVGSVANNLKNLNKPVWITSSQSEHGEWVADLAANGPKDLVTCFKPERGEGHHGSEALYAQHETSNEYWASLKAFLASLPE